MGCSHTIIPASEGHLFACPGSRIGSRVRWIRGKAENRPVQRAAGVAPGTAPASSRSSAGSITAAPRGWRRLRREQEAQGTERRGRREHHEARGAATASWRLTPWPAARSRLRRSAPETGPAGGAPQRSRQRVSCVPPACGPGTDRPARRALPEAHHAASGRATRNSVSSGRRRRCPHSSVLMSKYPCSRRSGSC